MITVEDDCGGSGRDGGVIGWEIDGDFCFDFCVKFLLALMVDGEDYEVCVDKVLDM